ncbi:PadR family transcriptional regulator [Gordonibacter sp. An230]|uniref:PadR family transcriptional regulator n=1 Tax=Gordonibacter sp. An230 TaxID=1965592 RepID=UPI000B3752BC|nr:PadR family transcriptional regulator [Gordonibacter sp. An230]OUO87768.1 PadR family transcriptional regulator [Gordonibacter sp. An230]
MGTESIALTEAVFYIPLSLDELLHGYGIMRCVERLSGGRVRLAVSTLCGVLDTLQKRRWIGPTPGGGAGRKKGYRLTDAGRDAVRSELARLCELVGNGEQVAGEWSR